MSLTAWRALPYNILMRISWKTVLKIFKSLPRKFASVKFLPALRWGKWWEQRILKLHNFKRTASEMNRIRKVNAYSFGRQRCKLEMPKQSASISKWLRGKENPMTNANIKRQSQVAQNSAQAAKFIYDHWQDVWNESDKPTPEAIAHTLTATFPFSENPQTWSPPDIATFTKALLDARGAAGCDGWSSMETQYIPIQAVQQLYRLTERWYRAAAVPRAFEYGRQVNLHKPSKIKNFQLDAAHTRPITVYSIFWRAYASAWMRTPAFQHFAQSLPEEIAGVYQHEGSEEAATVLQQKLALKQGVLVSLDYSQCYDRMNIHATFDFLESIRWPQPLIQQLRQVWQTKRLLEYDGQVHPEILVSSGVPQGCPIAPLTLATWMSSGSCAVQQLMQSEASYTEAEASQATTRIYMDDRSWVDADFDRALQRANQWHRWSASVGLKESREKSKLVLSLKGYMTNFQWLNRTGASQTRSKS